MVLHLAPLQPYFLSLISSPKPHWFEYSHWPQSYVIISEAQGVLLASKGLPGWSGLKAIIFVSSTHTTLSRASIRVNRGFLRANRGIYKLSSGRTFRLREKKVPLSPPMLTLLCQIGEFSYPPWRCENFTTLTSLGEHAATFFPVNLRFSELSVLQKECRFLQ